MRPTVKIMVEAQGDVIIPMVDDLKSSLKSKDLICTKDFHNPGVGGLQVRIMEFYPLDKAGQAPTTTPPPTE